MVKTIISQQAVSLAVGKNGKRQGYSLLLLLSPFVLRLVAVETCEESVKRYLSDKEEDGGKVKCIRVKFA